MFAVMITKQFTISRLGTQGYFGLHPGQTQSPPLQVCPTSAHCQNIATSDFELWSLRDGCKCQRQKLLSKFTMQDNVKKINSLMSYTAGAHQPAAPLPCIHCRLDSWLASLQIPNSDDSKPVSWGASNFSFHHWSTFRDRQCPDPMSR